MVKVRVSVTMAKEFLDWVDERIEERVFANRSHAFEYAIKRLMTEELKGKGAR